MAQPMRLQHSLHSMCSIAQPMGPWASLVAQTVKNPPAVWETWVRSLGWEDPLEQGMATHSSILAWRMSCTEDPGELYSPKGHKEWDMTKVTEHVHMYMCVYMCVSLRFVSS